jgi:hypothetical protein
MATPRLQHPVNIYLRKADKGETAVWDEKLKEPVGQVRRKQKPIKLRAQIGKGSADRAVATEGGTSEKSDGYLLFLTRELKTAKVTIEVDDRIVQIGEGDSAREVDYYVIRLAWRGHYPEHRGHTLLKAFFEDRQSSRVRD